MSVSLGPLQLKNPVMTASGTSGYGVDLLPFIDISLLGGIVSKSLSLAPREGNPPQRLAETSAAMLNSIGLQNIGVENFISEKLPALRAANATVIANIFGETVEEFAALARTIDAADGVSGIELNISCPNTERGGIEFGVDPDATSRVTGAVRQVTRLPLIVKLSPNVTDITLIARAARDAGADILSLTNTFMGMAIDVERRRPILSSWSGGLSGPAIKPMAVHLVSKVAGAVKLPLIGIGGISSGADAIEFLLAGASAVEVGTATFTEPGASLRVVREIEEYCTRHGLADVKTLIGALGERRHPAGPGHTEG